MRYVLDNNALIVVFTHYYRSRFPSFWQLFDELAMYGRILSVREVLNEIERYEGRSALVSWAKKNRGFFQQPTVEEVNFVQEIFAVRHFRALISQKSILLGHPVADPFVVAKANSIGGCVVTQETYKSNAAKIPNVCQRFNIPCMNLEGFMKNEAWQF